MYECAILYQTLPFIGLTFCRICMLCTLGLYLPLIAIPIPPNCTDPKTEDNNDTIPVIIIAAVAVAACCVLIVVGITLCIFAALYCIVPRCRQRWKVTDPLKNKP